ncbi:hypothetical protein ACFL5L_05200 [candidate division KSB1 bacterium]
MSPERIILTIQIKPGEKEHIRARELDSLNIMAPEHEKHLVDYRKIDHERYKSAWEIVNRSPSVITVQINRVM